MNIRFSSVFEEDFSRVIGRFATEVSPQLSIRFEEQLIATYTLIVSQPGIGRSRKDLNRPEIRSFRVSGFESYLIFYQARKGEILFIRLLHGAMDLPAIMLAG